MGPQLDDRVVVITGAGDKSFCAGADLKAISQGQNIFHPDHPEWGFAGYVQHFIDKPIIAAVNGAAAGGGLALVLASDIRLGAKSSKFNVAFVRIGFSACDIGTSWLLPRIVGVARAQELMLTGRVFDSAEAHRIGLLVDVVPDDDLLEVAFAKAEEISRNSPFGVALTKEAMWTALEIPGLQAAIDLENRQQILASHTDDAREAMRAFVEKRAPSFENR